MARQTPYKETGDSPRSTADRLCAGHTSAVPVASAAAARPHSYCHLLAVEQTTVSAIGTTDGTEYTLDS